MCGLEREEEGHSDYCLGVETLQSTVTANRYEFIRPANLTTEGHSMIEICRIGFHASGLVEERELSPQCSGSNWQCRQPRFALLTTR